MPAISPLQLDTHHSDRAGSRLRLASEYMLKGIDIVLQLTDKVCPYISSLQTPNCHDYEHHCNVQFVPLTRLNYFGLFNRWYTVSNVKELPLKKQAHFLPVPSRSRTAQSAIPSES